MIEKPQEIVIETMKPKKHPCQVCGGFQNVSLYAGGPFGWLCKTCEPIVEKIIDRYLDFLMFHDFRLVIGSLHGHLEQTTCAYCHAYAQNGLKVEKWWGKIFCNKEHLAMFEDELRRELGDS